MPASEVTKPGPGVTRSGSPASRLRRDIGRRIAGTNAAVGCFILSRLLLVLIPLGLFPYPSGDRVGDDVTLYASWADVIATGHYPIHDPMWQYPPLAGFVFYVASIISRSPTTGFMALALIVDAAIFIALIRASKGSGRLVGPWTYVVAGAAVGPVLLTRFDLFPTLLVVLALIAATRPVRAGIMLGIGALLKVWPIFLVIAWPRRDLGRCLAATLATGMAGMALLSLWGPGLLSFMNEQRERGLQIESVGGGLYVLAQMLGVDMDTAFRYGSLEIDAVGAAFVATVMTLAGAAGLLLIGYRRLRGKLEHVPVADVALVVVLISIASSRVFSPQYMIWVAGVAAVCQLDPNTRMRPIIWMLLPTALLGQIVYPGLYGQMATGVLGGSSLQVIRVGLLLAATIWATVLVVRGSPQGRRIVSPRRPVRRALAP